MSRNDDTPITIAGILEMTPGDKDNPVWINQPFTATVEECTARQTRTGTAMHSGTLTDHDTGASIAFTAFGRKFFPKAGTLVEVSGAGTSLGEYKDSPQLTIGAKAVVGTVADAPARSAAPAKAAAPAASQRATPSHSSTPFMGVTIGMALNNAGADARDALTPDELGDHEAVAKWVWIRASVYLKVAQALEAGKLARTTSGQAATDPEPERQPEPPPARRTAATSTRATDDGSAFGSKPAVDDEDVPF